VKKGNHEQILAACFRMNDKKSGFMQFFKSLISFPNTAKHAQEVLKGRHDSQEMSQSVHTGNTPFQDTGVHASFY
jgi:hypothetical protein